MEAVSYFFLFKDVLSAGFWRILCDLFKFEFLTAVLCWIEREAAKCDKRSIYRRHNASSTLLKKLFMNLILKFREDSDPPY